MSSRRSFGTLFSACRGSKPTSDGTANKQKEAEEARLKAVAEEARLKAVAEEARLKAVAEEARQKAAEEAAKKRAAEGARQRAKDAAAGARQLKRIGVKGKGTKRPGDDNSSDKLPPKRGRFITETELESILGRTADVPIILPPPRDVDRMLDELEGVGKSSSSLNAPGVPFALSSLCLFPDELKKREKWSSKDLVHKCLQSQFEALNNNHLLIENYSIILERNDNLRLEVMEEKEVSRAAKAQLEEVLKAQEAAVAEKSKALAEKEEALKEQAKAQYLFNSLEKQHEDTLRRLAEAVKRREEEVKKHEEEVRMHEEEKAKAVKDALDEFRSSDEFASLVKASIEDFKASDAFEAEIVKETAENYRRGFYTCKNWVKALHPEVPLDDVAFCSAAQNFDFYPEGYEAEEERAEEALSRGTGQGVSEVAPGPEDPALATTSPIPPPTATVAPPVPESNISTEPPALA